MDMYDDLVLDTFLKNQGQLFDEIVASDREEAADFLCDVMAVVAESKQEVLDYFEEEGLDMDGLVGEEILEADEVFDIGDGRYLIILA